MIYDVAKLKKGLEEAKDATAAAAKVGLKEGEAAVVEAAKRFVANGGTRTVNTSEAVLLKSPDYKIEDYDKAIRALDMFGCEQADGDELPFDAEGLLNGAGKVADRKIRVRISAAE